MTEIRPEVAYRALKISRATLYRWLASGKLVDLSLESILVCYKEIIRPEIEEEYKKILKSEGRLRRIRYTRKGGLNVRVKDW